MKEFSEQISDILDSTIRENPHIDAADVTACFSAFLDKVQSVLLDASAQLASSQKEMEVLDRELEDMARRITALFHQMPSPRIYEN